MGAAAGAVTQAAAAPPAYCAGPAGLLPAPQVPPALKGTAGTTCVSSREIGGVLLCKEAAVSVGRSLGFSLTSRKQGEED